MILFSKIMLLSSIKYSKFEISRFTPSGCKDIEIRKFELGAKTPFLCNKKYTIVDFKSQYDKIKEI